MSAFSEYIASLRLRAVMSRRRILFYPSWDKLSRRRQRRPRAIEWGVEFIQYIEVYLTVKKDGITYHRVTIYYKRIGAFEVPDRRKISEWDILLETKRA
ncbi:MAG: hypothetical protein ACOX7N_05015 [Lawsonibacter sp.]